MENHMTGAEGLLGVTDLVKMFEEAEEASADARGLSERDRDYYDGKQLTAEEQEALRKRGQPEVIINRIKRKVDFLVGLEKQQRTMPRGLPRTPLHQQDAEAVTDALRYVAESQDYHSIRSAVWRNMLVEGAGAVCVKVKPKRPSYGALMGSTALSPQQEYDICLKQLAWERFFHDPHSTKLDFTDAVYLGGVLWMDLADALALYGEDKREVLEATLTTAQHSDTYDDTPKWRVWADNKRKRVRVVFMWVKRADRWFFAEFTKGGILKAGPSPYKSEGYHDSDCEIIAQSAYVDRENNRYGVVREMISPQDEINKRRSKALHLLNTTQIVMEDGAVNDIEKMRREAARPDGVVVINPGHSDRFKFETRQDLANGHVALLQEAKAEIDLMGPNAAMQGDQGKEASGRAIMASQQGGMIEMGDLLDSLRHFDKRVFRAIWCRVRQFWTAPMWIRITDDERNVRFAAINGAVSQDGRVGPQIAELDVDIIIDDAPDTVAPAGETFEQLVQLKQMDANGELPFRVLIEAAPGLRNKEKLLQIMDEAAQSAGPTPIAQELQLRGAQAEIASKEAKAAESAARAQKTEIEAARLMHEPIAPPQPAVPQF
jgi:hypothetical protein